MKPLLQFSHANGFPAPCYRVLLDALAERFDVGFVPQFGHDPRYPVTDGWPHLVDELVAAVERRGAPVVAAGHSLGGYLSFLAAVKRPDLFRGLIILDAPLMSRFQGSALAFVKRVGLIDRISPAGGTRGRRREWPSHEAAVNHFRLKAVFRNFDPRCLEDYVRFGTQAHADGVRLTFDPDIEYRIYCTVPHHISRHVRALTVPGGLIVGESSHVLRQLGTQASRARLRIARMHGGHLFPFEHPEAAASALVRMAHQLGLV
jgi:pimeloyl-ACP methyl ester carboxylesterase